MVIVDGMTVVTPEEPDDGFVQVCVTVSGISGTVETPFNVTLSLMDGTGTCNSSLSVEGVCFIVALCCLCSGQW